MTEADEQEPDDTDGVHESSIPHPGQQKPREQLDMNWESLMDLLDSATSRATFWLAADILNDAELTEDEIKALHKMPTAYRQRVTASFLEYAAMIRNASRSLDAQLLLLTGELV